MSELGPVDNTVQLKKIVFVLILFIFEVTILKIIYNMASLNIKLTLKVKGKMILPVAYRSLLPYCTFM